MKKFSIFSSLVVSSLILLNSCSFFSFFSNIEGPRNYEVKTSSSLEQLKTAYIYNNLYINPFNDREKITFLGFDGKTAHFSASFLNGNFIRKQNYSFNVHDGSYIEINKLRFFIHDIQKDNITYELLN